MAVEILFQVQRGTHTPEEAAQEFARCHFGQPREIVGFDPIEFTFQLLNGHRTYKVVGWRPTRGKEFRDVPLWQIIVHDDPLTEAQK